MLAITNPTIVLIVTRLLLECESIGFLSEEVEEYMHAGFNFESITALEKYLCISLTHFASCIVQIVSRSQTHRASENAPHHNSKNLLSKTSALVIFSPRYVISRHSAPNVLNSNSIYLWDRSVVTSTCETRLYDFLIFLSFTVQPLRGWCEDRTCVRGLAPTVIQI